ncbi:MAG: glycosyltransferase [Bacteroidetes bacterium]|nr:glycosyltransferase [Bacteroidota bacterium]
MVKLTIITINYNNVQGLERTLKSVQAQGITNGLEYIVIDGGSTDGSMELIESFSTSIDYWKSEPDQGVYDAMNKGIQKASGEYLLFLNSGDHFYSDLSLKDQLSKMHGASIIAFSIETKLNGVSKVKHHPADFTLDFLYTDTFAHQSTLIKKSLFDSVGLYSTAYKIVSDWKFFLDATVKHGATYKSVEEVFTTYYLDGMSATADGTLIRKKERREILAKDYGFLNKDYQEFQLLKSNRFKALKAMESSGVTRKLNSLWLRLLLLLTKGKTTKDL